MLNYQTHEQISIRQLATDLLGNEQKWPLLFKANPSIPDERLNIPAGVTILYPETSEEFDRLFLQITFDLAVEGIESNAGGPFGAVVVRDDVIIGKGYNRVTGTNDPTAHAEIVAIRHACLTIKQFQLENCIIYSSCEPCPMCLGAIYWSRPRRLVYGCGKEDARNAGFDDQFIYEEINLSVQNRKISTTQMLENEAWKVFERWLEKENRLEY